MREAVNSMGYTPSQCRNGGLARARTAKRHPSYGIFLPNVLLFEDIMFPTCYHHGKEGGKARSASAKRDNKGRFLPD